MAAALCAAANFWLLGCCVFACNFVVARMYVSTNSCKQLIIPQQYVAEFTHQKHVVTSQTRNNRTAEIIGPLTTIERTEQQHAAFYTTVSRAPQSDPVALHSAWHVADRFLGTDFVKLGFTSGCPWGRVRDGFWKQVHPEPQCCGKLGWDNLNLIALSPGTLEDEAFINAIVQKSEKIAQTANGGSQKSEGLKVFSSATSTPFRNADGSNSNKPKPKINPDATCEAFRQKGNVAFKRQEFQKAVDHYSSALSAEDTAASA